MSIVQPLVLVGLGRVNVVVVGIAFVLVAILTCGVETFDLEMLADFAKLKTLIGFGFG